MMLGLVATAMAAWTAPGHLVRARVRRSAASAALWVPTDMGGGTSKTAAPAAPASDAPMTTSVGTGVDAALVTFCKSLKAADYQTFKTECVNMVSLTAPMTVRHGLYVVLKVCGAKLNSCTGLTRVPLLCWLQGAVELSSME